MSITAYTISVPEEALADLSQRLALTKFPSQLYTENEWDPGTPVSIVERLVNHWKHGFDWRKAEAQLNELPQFMTTIDVEGFEVINLHCTVP